MKAVEASAKTREEAIQSALKQLGVEMYEVDKIEIIDEGSKGILGFGARPVRVRLIVENMPDEPQRPAQQERGRREGGRGERGDRGERNRGERNDRGGRGEARERGENREGRENRESRDTQNGRGPRSEKPGGDKPRGERGNREGGERGNREGGERGNREGGRGGNKGREGQQQPRGERDAKPQQPRGERENRNRSEKSGEGQQRENQGRRGDREGQRNRNERRGNRPERAERPDRPERADQPDVVMEADEISAEELAAAAESPAVDTTAPITDEQGVEAAATLQEIITRMGVEGTATFVRTEDGSARINVSSEDSAILIGRKGKNLSAMQYLINRMISRADTNENTERIVVDVEGYVDRRRESLEELARTMATRAKETQRNMRLKPLSPQERRIIHLTLQDDEDIRTFSLGDSLFRSVVISPKGAARPERAPRPSRGGRGGRRRGGRGRSGDGGRHESQDIDVGALSD